MAYAFYQNAGKGWGTNEYEFCTPPEPDFEPERSWNGIDYFDAHATNGDRDMYNSVWERVRDMSGGGVGLREARHWHRQIYGGFVQLADIIPSDIGAAAAYEAYRMWDNHDALSRPLNSVPERQREALIGLSIAEATRLWQYSGRTVDPYGLRTAAEAAAFTASRIARRVLANATMGGTGGVGLGSRGMGVGMGGGAGMVPGMGTGVGMGAGGLGAGMGGSAIGGGTMGGGAMGLGGGVQGTGGLGGTAGMRGSGLGPGVGGSAGGPPAEITGFYGDPYGGPFANAARMRRTSLGGAPATTPLEGGLNGASLGCGTNASPMGRGNFSNALGAGAVGGMNGSYGAGWGMGGLGMGGPGMGRMGMGGMGMSGQGISGTVPSIVPGDGYNAGGMAGGIAAQGGGAIAGGSNIYSGMPTGPQYGGPTAAYAPMQTAGGVLPQQQPPAGMAYGGTGYPSGGTTVVIESSRPRGSRGYRSRSVDARAGRPIYGY